MKRHPPRLLHPWCREGVAGKKSSHLGAVLGNWARASSIAVPRLRGVCGETHQRVGDSTSQSCVAPAILILENRGETGLSMGGFALHDFPTNWHISENTSYVASHIATGSSL